MKNEVSGVNILDSKVAKPSTYIPDQAGSPPKRVDFTVSGWAETRNLTPETAFLCRQQRFILERLSKLSNDVRYGQLLLLFALYVQLNFALMKHNHAVAVL